VFFEHYLVVTIYLQGKLDINFISFFVDIVYCSVWQKVIPVKLVYILLATFWNFIQSLFINAFVYHQNAHIATKHLHSLTTVKLLTFDIFCRLITTHEHDTQTGKPRNANTDRNKRNHL